MEIEMTVGPKGQVVIPKPFRDEFDINPGTEVVVSDSENELKIRKKSEQIEKWVEEMEQFAKKYGKKNLKLEPHEAYEEEIEERWKKTSKKK